MEMEPVPQAEKATIIARQNQGVRARYLNIKNVITVVVLIWDTKLSYSLNLLTV